MTQTDQTALKPGDVVPPRELATFDDHIVRIPETGRIVHLQFRRFAGCPVCKLHLRAIGARIAELEAVGIREIAVFHSSAGALRRHGIRLPFAVIADEARRFYGVQFHPEVAHTPRGATILSNFVRGIAGIEPVGNYAVQPTFSDGHNTGIFTWDYLYKLGSQQDVLWEGYLRRLHEAGFEGDSGREPGAKLSGDAGHQHHHGCGHKH